MQTHRDAQIYLISTALDGMYLRIVYTELPMLSFLFARSLCVFVYFFFLGQLHIQFHTSSIHFDMNDAISYNLLIHFIMIKFIIIFGTYSFFPIGWLACLLLCEQYILLWSCWWVDECMSVCLYLVYVSLVEWNSAIFRSLIWRCRCCHRCRIISKKKFMSDSNKLGNVKTR